MLILVRPVQPLKALLMEVTVLGIVTVRKLLQPANAEDSRVVRDAGRFSAERELQPENA